MSDTIIYTIIEAASHLGDGAMCRIEVEEPSGKGAYIMHTTLGHLRSTAFSLTLDDFQRISKRTAISGMDGNANYLGLKLAGEAGEVCEIIGKALRDNEGEIDEERRAHIADELGDVLWYVAMLGRLVGFDLSAIALRNIEKLQSRRERGVIRGSGDDR